MKFTAFLLTPALLSGASAAKADRTVLVQLREKDAGAVQGGPAAACAALAERLGGSVSRTYSRAIYGCALRLASAEKGAGGGATVATALASLAADPRVARAEEDQVVSVPKPQETQKPGHGDGHDALSHNSNGDKDKDNDADDYGYWTYTYPPTAGPIPGYSWGLDRVNQCELPLDTLSTPKVDGTGVRIYIVDTGIERRHDEFAGMIDKDSGCNKDTTEEFEEERPFVDGHGHG
jgi:subtilisin family serine protease